MMDWNLRTPTLWEWDNLTVLGSKVCETPKQVQLPEWGFNGDVGVDNASIYSSGGGGYSGSDFANGSSSKSSVSASVDSSSKPGDIITEFNVPCGDCAKEFDGNRELNKVENSGTSDQVASGGCGEPLIGLKLGKRTYFKDVCAGTSTNASALCKKPSLTTNSVKKTRVSSQSVQNARCQVEGCNIDLTAAKDYHRRHRVCEAHSKCPRVVVAGVERRFCQQCSRFHDVSEFDEKKRSCRRRLSDHNARRRKPQPDGVSFSSSGFSLPFYDHGQHLNFTLARVPVHTRSTSNSLWEDSCAFRLSQPKGSWMRTAKLDVDGQMFCPNAELPNSLSTLRHDYDGLLLKGNTAEVLNQGLEASIRASNLEGTLDLQRALSLLSTTNSWGQTYPGISPSDQLAHAALPQPVMHVHQGLLHSGSEQWQTQHRSSAEAHIPPLSLDGNVGQLQEFQLFRTAYESTFSNHIP